MSTNELTVPSEAERFSVMYDYASKNGISLTPGVELCKPGYDLTVVVPAYNEADFIQHTMGSLDNSSVPIEVVVVDNNSDDATSSIVDEFSRNSRQSITLLHENQNRGPVHSRKRGMDEVIAHSLKAGLNGVNRIIAMTDADTMVTSNWAEEILNTFKTNENIGAVGGRFSFDPELDKMIYDALRIKDFFSLIPQMAYRLATIGMSTVLTYGANSAISVYDYALIGGSQQPVDENGNQVKGSDIRFGREVEKAGRDVAFLPVMVTTSARRELYALGQDLPHAYFSSMQGWVDVRSQDKDLLESLLQHTSRDKFLNHRTERLSRFVKKNIVTPFMQGKIDSENLHDVFPNASELVDGLKLLTTSESIESEEIDRVINSIVEYYTN